ncbi:MAG: SGNH/GDSL hydrolase family protein [Armatimonadetes bacterium]|nr:SGNH/GDSL hydrolase family protein [Armatimonadota bacterium]
MASTPHALPVINLPVPRPGMSPQGTLTLTVADTKGRYTIPYIQSPPTVSLQLQFSPTGPLRCHVRLLLGETVKGTITATRACSRVQFHELTPAEYSVELTALGDDGASVGVARHERLGIGTVLCAIGDSITEGYHGHAFWRDDLDLRSDVFPAEAVSRDGRNFPQHAPTTPAHRPEVNCFQSWMTDLNDLLTERWGQPVFIANEGWGGITSGGYLHMMQTDRGWQERMELLRPSVWLIHLGVNDERAGVTPAAFAANIEAIADLLISDYDARPGRVLVARPCYDYAEGCAEMERAYIAELDRLIARRGLAAGPDFFAAYAVDRARWYGDDPVHPNVEGMAYMAGLWADALIAAFPEGVPG